jgi:hypothetical protein
MILTKSYKLKNTGRGELALKFEWFNLSADSSLYNVVSKLCINDYK